MKILPGMLKSSKGVVMVIAIVILLAVTALGIAMVTSAVMSSTIAKNYKYKLQSFYAADGQMTVLSQAIIDGQMSNWIGGGNTFYIGLPANKPTGVTPVAAADLALDTIGFTHTSGQRFNLSTNPYLYSKVMNGVFAAGTWIDSSICSVNGGGTQTYKCSIYRTNIDGTNATGICSTTVTNSGGWYQCIVFNMPSVPAETLSNQRLRAGFSLTSGTTGQMSYGTTGYINQFGGCLTPPPFSTSDSLTMGNFKVLWSIAQKADNPNNYTIQVTSLQKNSKWGPIFETPLTQDIDRQYGGGFQLPGATASVPVTYYDYHSNRTNPEFEQPCLNAAQKNMVGNNLDAERKPVVGAGACLNYCIAKWFRPWTPGDTTIPVYHQTVLQYTTVDSTAANKTLVKWLRPGAWNGGEWGNASCNEVNAPADDQNPVFEKIYRPAGDPKNDTAFKNVVIQSSLVFTLLNAATGTYQFNQSGFWPLDGIGFGNEWVTGYQKANATTPTPDTSKTHLAVGVWPHNFAFTMSISRTFVKTPHDTFAFTGDDDIWLFLNNKLVMDLGGPHAGGDMTVLIDSCFKNTGNLNDTMVNYQTYNFDFFYCERHSTQSNCKITTNILYYYPAQSQRRSWRRTYGTLD
jgi:fibro-slime domain-containing protein